jgi:hypothetical protein
LSSYSISETPNTVLAFGTPMVMDQQSPPGATGAVA